MRFFTSKAMMRTVLAAITLGLVSACAGVEADLPRPPAEEPPPPPTLARVGPFEVRLVLTGALEAVRSSQLTAPRVPGGELQIRWMAEDGAPVGAGEKVLEFDNATFTTDLEDRKLTARKEEMELRRLEAQSRAEAAEKKFAVEERRVGFEKARLEADVPRELIPLRELREKELALERARAELEKAKDDLETHVRAKEQEIALKRLALQKTLYDIRVAEEAIEALVLEAPENGVLVVAELPWEGRKFQEGDNAWPGIVLMSLPDLSEMRVTARLSDVDDGLVKPGMKAKVTLDAHPDLEIEGEIASVSPVALETSPISLRRAFTVTVSLSETDPERMRPGMAARVDVLTDARERALLVPRSALVFTEEGARALLAGGELRDVELDGCSAFECVVREGLSPGDEVLAEVRP
jgi:multidrug efflux pump subunit AcrA (membrane-fusion protein)